MTFVIHMAFREIRASWRRLLFFFICISIGVSAIVALRSVIQSVRNVLAAEARGLIAADILISSNSPWPESVDGAINRERDTGRVTKRTETIEVATMVRPAAADVTPRARMVELRAVQEQFPLYGDMTLQGGEYFHKMLAGHGVIVRPELLTHLSVGMGDKILIGTETFEIRGIIGTEPGADLGMFSLGPRIIIDHADLLSTGLLGFGSRVSYEMLLAVPGDTLDELTRQLDVEFANEFVRVRSYRRSEDRMGRNLVRAENYLSLVGLVVLILGGIGVSSVTRVFVQQKMRSIAILKCVGATSRSVLAVYVTQVLTMGLAGSMLGVVMAAGIVASMPFFVTGMASPFQIEYGLTADAMVQGVAIGVLVSLLFSIIPLLDIRHVKPSVLLRQDFSFPRTVDWLKWCVAGTVAVVLVSVAVWQSGSLEMGLWLSVGFVATACVLHLAGTSLLRVVKPLCSAKSFALRQAVLHVSRPGNQTRVILLAVGLGAFFILGVRSLQANLLIDFDTQMSEDSPDMFLMDVQEDQREAVVNFLELTDDLEAPDALIPVLRARMVALEGENVILENYEAVRGRGRVSREYTVTYRARMEENERLVAGTWWPSVPMTGEPEVSIEQSIRERLDIEIGDRISFDVQGLIVTANVTSVREVDFRDFRAGGFMFVFRPGTFTGTPHGYIATLRGPQEIEIRAQAQTDIVQRFPNVSVIDVREVLNTVQSLVTTVTLAVTVVGGLVLLSGILILVGAVSMTKFKRVYETAILKTLGANSRLIMTMLLLEYGVLGAIAGTVGALGAIVLSWAVATYGLEMAWEPTPLITLVGVLVTTALVAVVGVASSLDVLRHRPLATLRSE
jgi:putative ABC transport system permease protein